jgi:hypothetical protein
MKIVYQPRLVAFIDVLGFKNLVFGETTGPIETYYGFLLSKFNAAVEQRGFDYMLISDSIVIYCDDKLENFFELMKMINIAQAGLLGKGVLMRGAISHGGLFVDKANSIIVGSGLINAYNLEAQAKFPRTIVDRSLVKKYFESISDALTKCTVGGLPHLSIRPLNGHQVDFPYLNYGCILGTSLSKKPFEGALSALRDNYYKNEHAEKFEWLKGHLAACFEDMRTHLLGLPSPNANERKRIKRAEENLTLLGEL